VEHVAAFLRPARGRANLVLWTEAEVQGVALAEGHNGLAAGGVVVRRRGEGAPVTVEARREVILAAGAINSPKLLMLSGVGPGEALRGLGLAVRAEVPGVGENLQDHLQIRAVYRVDGAKTLNTLAAGPVGKARIALEYALTRRGPMSMAPSQLGAFTRSSPERAHPDIEFHVQPLSLDAFGEPLHPYPAFTASVCNLNPTSRGRVELRSPDPGEAPAIRPNYLATDEDRRVAAQSLRVVRRVVGQAPLARFRPEELKPGREVAADEDLARAAGDIATTIFHPVGTTAMGRDGDRAAVLDPHLRVRDGRGGRIAGLRVVDAGAMPVIPSGNTASPVLMMAEKAARWIIKGD
jgi:choline dehydrogenase